MRRWLGGKPAGLAAFGLIAALLAGGLGWATRAALRLEREQTEQQRAADESERLRLALWRLDGRVAAILAREESRPFNDYSAVSAPLLALGADGQPLPAGSVIEPSPLLGAELPAWMLLHFQADRAGWESPQVPSPALEARLRRVGPLELSNVTAARKALLGQLKQELPAEVLLGCARNHTRDATIRDRVLLALQLAEQNPPGAKNPLSNEAQNFREYVSRSGNQTKLAQRRNQSQAVAPQLALANTCRNGEAWLRPPGAPGAQLSPGVMQAVTPPPSTTYKEAPHAASTPLPPPRPSARVAVSMTPMVGAWLPTRSGPDRLVVLRLVRLGAREVCQGIVLDGPMLAGLLAEEVQDLFAGAAVRPATGDAAARLDRMMTALPFVLETPAAPAADDPGWTALRVGLSLAWSAAGVALLAVGLGGWSLLRLSERRMQFVWAVTHELRTPLTTLQLYLDLLLGGVVRGPQQQTEYLQTLHAETDRLARLVGNVLDFSRLEGRRPGAHAGRVEPAAVLAAVRDSWAVRCGLLGKELVVEDGCPAGTALRADGVLLEQVLGNLLDNACKYSREAADRRVWLRARPAGGRVVLEVEDRGPGVPPGERRAIFRAFRRGRCAGSATGGVGLGLALARRWVGLLGGRLTLACPPEGGACFQVALQAEAPAGPVKPAGRSA